MIDVDYYEKSRINLIEVGGYHLWGDAALVKVARLFLVKIALSAIGYRLSIELFSVSP